VSGRVSLGLLSACVAAAALVVAAPAPEATALVVTRPIVGMAATTDGGGYWEVASDGGIFSFGDAGFHGSMGGTPLNEPIVGMARTTDGGGYWEVASDGGIFSFGDAPFFGSTGGLHLDAPIVGMDPTPDGGGYWLVASDGGVFSYGDAAFFGSVGGRPLDAPIVGLATAAGGAGYWEVASDGGIFAFGGAAFFGSEGGRPLDAPIVGLAAAPGGAGYWEVAEDGGIFSFGRAPFFGSPGGVPLSKPVVGMTGAPGGYWESAADGGIFNYGSARFLGSVPELPPPGPPRIVVYGDSLVSEAGADFTSLASDYGAAAQIRTYGGTATCDWLPTMATDAQAWQPTAVVLAFSGNAFSPCMAGYQLGTPPYYAKYQRDTQDAIDIFRAIGTKVVLVGLPVDASPNLSENVTQLNLVYQTLAAGNVGVTYDDAGLAVEVNGQFTWALPCLAGEPCTGPSGTNLVRSPDGIHFCPDGHTTLDGSLEQCDVYSSGALRFAAAMLGAARSPLSLP
jgi:hypothetical protein